MNLNQQEIKLIFDKVKEIEEELDKFRTFNSYKSIKDKTTELRQTIAAIYIKSVTGDE